MLSTRLKVLFITIPFCFLLSVISLHSQSVKYSNEFLAIGVGAKQLALGSAAAANSTDVYASYWNPAGLTFIENNIQLGGMHNSYFAGVGSFNYLALATKVSDSTKLSFSYLRFGIDNIPNTLHLIDEAGNIRYDNVTSFSSVDNAFLISFARITRIPNLRIGVNAKIIYRSAGEFAEAYGFGIDLGAYYTLKKWNIAAVLRDATSTFNSWSFTTEEFADVFALTGNEIPEASTEITRPRLILAANRELPVGKKIIIKPEIDLDITFDGKRNTLIKSDIASIDPKLGIEFGYKEIVFIRTGICNMQKVNDKNNESSFDFQPSIGLGLQLKKLAIDYAFTDIGDQSIALYSNIFSLRLAIDPKH